MAKSIRPLWFLQQEANAIVEQLAPGSAIVPAIQNEDDEIIWSDGVGRVVWDCGYLMPSDDPALRALIPMFNKAMVRLQSRYDLGLTCERV